MAEFCLDCWNKISETNDPPEKYIISKDLDFCEECREWKPVIVMEKRAWIIRQLFPLRVLFFPVELVVRLILGIIRIIRENHY